VKFRRAADYPWSARLVAMLPTWMPCAHVHLNLCDDVQRLLLSISARSMDRMLRGHRTDLKRRIYGRSKPGTLLKHQIPVRTGAPQFLRLEFGGLMNRSARVRTLELAAGASILVT